MRNPRPLAALAAIAWMTWCSAGAAPPDSPPQRRREAMSTHEDLTRQEGSTGRLSSGSSNSSATVEGRGLDHYFPLQADCRWEYEVEVTRSDDTKQTFTAVKLVKGDRTIAEKAYVRVVTEVAGGSMRIPDQFYRVAGDGVYAAVQGAEGQELLVLPASPQSRRSWRGEAEPAIAELTGETTTGQTLALAGRELSGCVRVSLAMVVVERSFFGGEKKVPVRLDRWFAPGIGMVREVRTVGEDGGSGYLKTDSRLVRWSGGSDS